MSCGGLAEDPFPTRDRILPEMGEDTPMGLVPTPKECRTRILIDLGILIIPTTGIFQHYLAELDRASPGGGRREAGMLGTVCRVESCRY